MGQRSNGGDLSAPGFGEHDDTAGAGELVADQALKGTGLCGVKAEKLGAVQMEDDRDTKGAGHGGEQRFAPEAAARGGVNMRQLDAMTAQEGREGEKGAEAHQLAPPEGAIGIGGDEPDVLALQQSRGGVALDNAAHAAARGVPDHELHWRAPERRYEPRQWTRRAAHWVLGNLPPVFAGIAEG